MSRHRFYISARAVREFAEIRGLELDDGGPLWGRAEEQLRELSWHSHLVETPDGEPRLTRNGLQEWRTGRAHGRLRLLVSTEDRPEGELDQVVQVLPSHGGRRRR